jgi:hypothetical protein
MEKGLKTEILISQKCAEPLGSAGSHDEMKSNNGWILCPSEENSLNWTESRI